MRLNLAWNGLGDQGAEAVGGSIKENSALQFLDVSSNRIELAGAGFIADGSKENQTLRSLQLNGNPIGDKGVVLIIEAVGERCSVRDLGVQDCSTFKSGDGSSTQNPTGRYKLELSDAFDLERFEKLRKLDLMDEASGIDNFINVKLGQTRRSTCPSMARQARHTKMETTREGLLLFDYVSAKRVPGRRNRSSETKCSNRSARSWRTRRSRRTRSCSYCAPPPPPTIGPPTRPCSSSS